MPRNSRERIPVKDLRSFLKAARESGPDCYVECRRTLKSELEVGIIQHKLAKEGRFPALFCPQIENSTIPLVTNVFGSIEMYALAFDMKPGYDDHTAVLKEYMKRMNRPIQPTIVPPSKAPVKEIVIRGDGVDLQSLPLLKHAEMNSGKYMTMNPFICKDPMTGIPNVGIYRHELRGRDEVAAQIHPANHGAIIAQRHAKMGRHMEAVIISGHHPAAIFGACQPGPLDMNEFEIMGGLLGEPLRLTTGETVDIPVPADAEIAIEGTVEPGEMITDGPFSEFLGYYGEKMPAYRMKVKCITMRKDPIYLDLDASHREHPMSMMLPLEAAVTGTVSKVVADLRAVHFPPSGSCSHHAYISIKKSVQGEGKRAALAALAAVQFLKLVVVVDEDIDIFRDEEVLWAISTRVRGDLDIDIIPGITGNRMDPVGPYDELHQRRVGGGGFMTTKVIIDATKPKDLPFPVRVRPSQELWDSMELSDYLRQ